MTEADHLPFKRVNMRLPELVDEPDPDKRPLRALPSRVVWTGSALLCAPACGIP